MSYIEIKAIKAVAALHRGVVNTAIRTLNFRNKRAYSKYENQHEYADSLDLMAARTKAEANNIRLRADDSLFNTQKELSAAECTVLNLRDDLNKIA